MTERTKQKKIYINRNNPNVICEENKRFRVTLSSMYKWLYYHRWDDDLKKKVTKKQYKTFLYTFFYLMFKKIIEEHFIFHMPYKLGSLFIKRINEKKRKKVLDFGHYLATGERRVYTNIHSFGYRFAFKWDKSIAYFRNMGLFVFKPSEKLKQKLYREIIERSEDPTRKSYVSH